MDGECAFCGRADEAAWRVFCADCADTHAACVACAEEVSSTEAELYRLVA